MTMILRWSGISTVCAAGVGSEACPAAIVENALEHGLDVKEEGEKLLKLYFFEENGDVVIRVEDNGIGMEQEQAEKLLTYQAKGYGLKNVNDRMCILYGEKYAIRILSKVGEGTSVDMRIPKEVKKDET